MTYWEIVNKVSGDIGLSPDTVDKTYKAFWKYIRNTIQELPLKEDMSEEEFLMLRPNFNIPSLGKLTCTYKRYSGVREKFKHIKKLRESHEGT
jgi:hypothetical protein